MKTLTTTRPRGMLPEALLIAGILLFTSAGQASTFWNGPNTNFTQVSGNSDLLVAGHVAIGRNFGGWLFNSAAGQTFATTASPSDTLWAVGSPSLIGNLSAANVAGLTFIPFGNASVGSSVRSVAQAATPGRPDHVSPYVRTGNGSGGPITFVVHLVNEDIYLTLTFSAWQNSGQGFSYARSTPSAVTPPTPTISITNPVSGAVFAAPANVKINVNASVSSGTITNVSVFSNSVALGSSQTAPFNITTTSLGAGSYPLTAVATAAGISGTSAVVNFSVVTPVITSLSGASQANNQFSFNYNVNPGLSYDVENSSNLFNWTPLLTNTPSSSPATFSTNITGDQNFYRVGRLPNP